MILSSETIAVLKNFASINPNVVIPAGCTINTIAESKTVMASASISEEIPTEFGIYDLNEFLSVVGLFDEPNLEFDGSTSVKICSADGKQSVRYYFSDPSILTHPQKLIKLPGEEYGFDISTDQINTLRRAASTLGVTDLVITIDGTEGQAEVTDLSNGTANSFTLDLGDVVNENDVPAKLVFNIANLKLIPGDYSVKISEKLISQFNAKEGELKYWVALEKTSTIGE